MEKNAHYFLVGVFMSIAVAALVGFVIWIAGSHEKKDYVFYTVAFTDSISGLEKGAEVQYKGVKVGEVIKTRLVPGIFNLVRVDIGVNKDAPIRANTKVTIATQGFAGSLRLEMSTEDGETGMPEKIPGEPYPMLEGSGSQLYKALADISVITAQTREFIVKLNAAMDGPSAAVARTALSNIEHMTRDLNGLLSPANVSNISLMVDNLSQASIRAPTLMDSLHNASQQAGQAAGGLNGMLRRNSSSVDHFASQGLPALTAATREAKGAAASVHKLTDKLGENPSQILYQPSTYGVEIPK